MHSPFFISQGAVKINIIFQKISCFIVGDKKKLSFINNQSMDEPYLQAIFWKNPIGVKNGIDRTSC
jgi:hypothetical protein